MDTTMLPEFIFQDLNTIKHALGDELRHYGIFGSALARGVECARDIDVLLVFGGATFESLLERIENLALSLPFVSSYRNYGVKIAEPPEGGKYYDLVFVPRDRPDRDFMRRIDGTILYVSEPFESWRQEVRIAPSLATRARPHQAKQECPVS